MREDTFKYNNKKTGGKTMANRPNILALASKISLESMTYTGITYKVRNTGSSNPSSMTICALS